MQCGDILGVRRQRAARSSHNTYYANQNVRQNARSVQKRVPPVCLAVLACGVPAVLCLPVIIQSGGRAAQAVRGAIRQGGRGVRVLSDVGVPGLAALWGWRKKGGYARREGRIYTTHVSEKLPEMGWGRRKQGVGSLEKAARKNYKPSAEALVEDGWIMCPKCRAKLGRAEYGAVGKGIVLYCRGRDCKMPVRVKF